MRVVFGECSLDTESREFLRRGKAAHLSPKAFDLLSILIRQRPRVVRKADLMQSLWPDTYVVEGNLPVLVAELRDAIGHRGEAGKAIKTHHGIGYSFSAHVDDSRQRGDAGDSLRAALKIEDRRIMLESGENDIGRDANCAVYIEDASVSRHHASITIAARVATLVDQGSKNGTRVNDTVVKTPTVLRDGDELMFGQIRATFVAPRKRDAATTLTLPINRA